MTEHSVIRVVLDESTQVLDFCLWPKRTKAERGEEVRAICPIADLSTRCPWSNIYGGSVSSLTWASSSGFEPTLGHAVSLLDGCRSLFTRTASLF